MGVINFGRDSYGMLQMFHLANAMTKEFKPDLIIIAFITNDLTRARFWRTVNYIKGEKRLLTTTQPICKAALRNSIDTTMNDSLYYHAVVWIYARNASKE